MAISSTAAYRCKNFLLAIASFAMMIVLPGELSVQFVRFGMYVSSFRGFGLPHDLDAAVAFITFLQEHMNLYSALVYLLFGIPVYLWLYIMYRRARAYRAGMRARRALECPVGASPDSRLTEPGSGGEAPSSSSASQQMGTDGAAGAFRSKAASRYASLRVRSVDARYFAAGALFGYGMQFVTTLIMVAVNMVLPQVMEEYSTLVESSGITAYGFMWVISTLILPPVVEEAGFRGLGMTYLLRAGLPFCLANVLQAVAFGLFHMNLTQGLYTALLALAMGYVAHASGSIVPAMVLHLTYNFMGTLGQDLIYEVVPLPFLFLLVTGIIADVYAMRLIARAREDGAREDGAR